MGTGGVKKTKTAGENSQSFPNVFKHFAFLQVNVTGGNCRDQLGKNCESGRVNRAASHGNWPERSRVTGRSDPPNSMPPPPTVNRRRSSLQWVVVCTPLFPDQYQAALDGRLPEPVRIPLDEFDESAESEEPNQPTHKNPELWVRAVPMPGSEGPQYVYSMVFITGHGVTVVDPGWPDRNDFRASIAQPLNDFLIKRGRSIQDIKAVIATHAHPDHLGAAGPLAQLASAKLVMSSREWTSIEQARGNHPANPDSFALTEESIGAPAGALDLDKLPGAKSASASAHNQWFFPKLRPDVLLEDGERLDQLGIPALSDLPWEVVITPGHTDGHMCLIDRAQKILIAADQIIPTIFPGIGLSVAPAPGNPIEHYLDSLIRISEFGDFRVLSGHGYCFADLPARIDETAQHVLQRAREVQDILSQNEKGEAVSVWSMASKMTWSAGWNGMVTSPRLLSGLRQTMMYRDLVQRVGLGTWERHFA